MTAAAARITELAVEGFRNLHDLRIVPDPRANVLVGSNGQGKTSVLEAVDYAASLRSFRGANRAQLVGHETDRAAVRLCVSTAGLAREYRVTLTRTSRDVLLDGRRPERALEYFSNAACVVFQPGDLDLVRGPPELRRRLLDRVLVRAVDGYGEALKTYSRALRARNALLRARTPDARAVRAYDLPLARHGAHIVRARSELVPELVIAARRAIDNLATASAPVDVVYRTRSYSDPVVFADALAKNLTVDLARGATQLGPHGDDLALTWRGRAARVVASQGQARTLALALRLAELEVIEARTHTVPVLLLDDVSSELDRDRTERLFTRVASLGGQVWVTTTDPAIAALVPGAMKLSVHDGTVVTK